ncbi:MAG TPA: hypothetical protein VNK48_14525 [Xanthobacteraceae bacterium]|nr:hypothetical protein [Xanthobacteraceae bacterium]
MHDPRHNGGPPIEEDDAYGADGWVAIARRMRWHPLVGCGQPVKPANPERGAWSRYEAWQDLIMECRYAAGTINNGGRLMEIKPGQLVGAVSWLGQRWNWTPKTVRWFLDRLEEEGMIEAKYEDYAGARTLSEPGKQQGKHRGKQARVITICKYDIYQLARHYQGQMEGQLQGQINGKSTANEGQHLNKETKKQYTLLSEIASDDEVSVAKPTKKRPSYDEPFERFWKAYPDTRNNSKANAFAEWRRLTLEERAAAMASLPVFQSYCRANPDYRVVHAERYLKHRRWESHQPGAQTGEPWWANPARLAAMTAERWRKGIAEYANGLWPVDKLGPPPGSAGCVVPPQIVRELRLTEIYNEHGIRRS